MEWNRTIKITRQDLYIRGEQKRSPMDSTPIKVRGKRKLPWAVGLGRSSDPKPDTPWDRKRPLSPSSVLPTSPKKKTCQAPPSQDCRRSAHPLERLPAELLESILLQCLNVSLPQASPIIGCKLSSSHVKTQLVLKVCSAGSSASYPSESAAIFPTVKEQADAQSAILRLRWLNLTFIRSLIPEYITNTLVRELGARRLSWLGTGPPVSKASKPTIRRYLDDISFRFGQDPAGRLPAYWEVNWDTKHTKDTKSVVSIGISLRDGLVTLHECSHKTLPSNVKNLHKPFYRWMVLSCIEGCQIPEKLLHGPWTDEKCELLELVTRGNATVDWVGTTSGEIAERGFLEALRERNARAVKALLAQVEPVSVPVEDNDSLVCYHNKKPLLVPCPKHLGSCFLFPSRKGAGIVPRPEHLKIAVIEEDCQPDVVKALIQCTDWNINHNNDICLWAYKHQSEDNSQALWLWKVLKNLFLLNSPRPYSRHNLQPRC